MHDLKKWLELEDLKSKILKADNSEVGNLICAYLTAGVSDEKWGSVPYYEAIEAFSKSLLDNLPGIDFPLFKIKPEKEDDWTYEGRTWYVWAHLLGNAYGWTLEYTAGLNPNDAIGLIHEILAQEYHAREWQWGLSEIAYEYDKTTKKSNYRPLKKPEWMQTIQPEPKTQKTKIRRDLIPVGNIVRWNRES